MSKLVLSNLGKMFGNVAAVQGVSLTLTEGEFVSLLGPSGCGKTTTLRMIAGFITPDSGSIAMNGAMLLTSSPTVTSGGSTFPSLRIWAKPTLARRALQRHFRPLVSSALPPFAR